MSSKKAKDQEPLPYQALLYENHALQDEVQSLRLRLAETEELRRAISEGDLDALILPGPEGEMVFTLDNADRSYRVLVETMNEGTATLALDGTILYCNRHLAEFLKMPLQTIIGSSIYRFIAPENVMTFKAFLEHEIDKGAISFLADDGTSLPVYLSISSMKAEGSPNAWCLVVTDLTEQKKNEEILAAGRLARSIIEQAAETIIVCDTLGRITHFSNAASKICKCIPTFQKFENLINLRFSEGAHVGESILPVSSALKGSAIFGMEATLELENCLILHLLLNSGPLKNDDDEIIGCVVTLTDITELKNTEEELRQMTERERFLADVVEKANMPFGVGALDGSLLMFNQAFVGLTGYSREELTKRQFTWAIDLTPPEWREDEAKHLAEAIRTRQPVRYEKEYLRKDGTRVPIELFVQPVFDTEGNPLHYCSFLTDITERKQEEQRIRRYNSILEGINRIFGSVVKAEAEEDLENTCLSVALEVTGGKIGFVGLLDDDGLLHDVAISEGGLEQCLMYDKTGHRRPPGNFALHGLYGRVINSGKGFFTNDPQSHPDSIGLPNGHPPLMSLLGVPLILDGKTMGMIAVANREGGYSCEQLEALEAIALAVMQALQRKRSAEALREAYEQIQMQSEELQSQSEELKVQSEELQTQSEELQVQYDTLQARSEELQETYQLLHDSENKFRTLAENSPDIIARFDRQKRYIYVNPAFAEPYGQSPEKTVGKTNSELGMDPELVKFWEEYYENVFATGKPEKMEFRYKSPQGKEYYFDTQIVPEFVSDKVNSVLAISHDITNIKEAEAKLERALNSVGEKVKERTAELEKAYRSLKESEENLAEAQRMACIGSWNWDIRTNGFYLSDGIYRIFGRTPQEFGANYNAFLNYVHPDDRENVNKVIIEALNGRPYNIDHRIILANGKERVVHEQGEVIYDEQNIPIRMRGTIQDITERKRAEEALYKSEMRLRRFYESGIIGVFYYKMDGSIIEANKKFLEMVGYTREDLQAGRIKWDKMTPPEYRPLEEYALAELKTTGIAKPYEKEYTRKDGSRIPIILGVANIEGPRDDGIAFVLDITERKEAEEALAKIEIARKQEIHHRIKNNLQVISSLLDLQAEKFIDRDDIKDSEVLEAFRESQDRVISMALIHEELYKGGVIDKLDFSSYIEELAENLFLTYRLRNRDISLSIDLEEDLFFDMDTAVPLGMIVNELVSNSFKHAFTGKDKGDLHIQLHKDESIECKSRGYKSTNFTLTVSDDGIGIPENLDIENLDSLGLQLVTSLVDQLDGELKLKRNNGTEFTVKFTVT